MIILFLLRRYENRRAYSKMISILKNESRTQQLSVEDTHRCGNCNKFLYKITSEIYNPDGSRKSFLHTIEKKCERCGHWNSFTIKSEDILKLK